MRLDTHELLLLALIEQADIRAVEFGGASKLILHGEVA